MYLKKEWSLLKSTFFYVTPFSPVEFYRNFRRRYCLYLQGRIVRQASNMRLALIYLLADYLLGLLFDPRRGEFLLHYTASHRRKYYPLRHQYVLFSFKRWLCAMFSEGRNICFTYRQKRVLRSQSSHEDKRGW
jgi:hypothetical protein